MKPFWISLLLACIFIPLAEANIYYFEFGGGLASGQSIQTHFPNSTQADFESAFSVPVTLGYQLQESQTGILFSLAGQVRYVSGSNASGNYTLLTTSPVLRMEIWRLVLGVGYAPWVWQDLSFTKLQANSLTLEAQFLFPITPEIDFGLQAARQTISPKGSGSEMQTLEYGAFFRLNFGLSEKEATARKRYKGWRYPFGNPKR